MLRLNGVCWERYKVSMLAANRVSEQGANGVKSTGAVTAFGY